MLTRKRRAETGSALEVWSTPPRKARVSKSSQSCSVEVSARPQTDKKQSGEESSQVEISTMDGKSIQLCVAPSCAVEALKLQIQAATGLPASCQVLASTFAPMEVASSNGAFVRALLSAAASNSLMVTIDMDKVLEHCFDSPVLHFMQGGSDRFRGLDWRTDELPRKLIKGFLDTCLVRENTVTQYCTFFPDEISLLQKLKNRGFLSSYYLEPDFFGTGQAGFALHHTSMQF